MVALPSIMPKLLIKNQTSHFNIFKSLVAMLPLDLVWGGEN